MFNDKSIIELLPEDSNPSYLQLYFYDTKHELKNCAYDSRKLDPTIIIAQLIDILQVNPYSFFFFCFFQTHSDVSNLEDHVIRRRSDIDFGLTC